VSWPVGGQPRTRRQALEERTMDRQSEEWHEEPREAYYMQPRHRGLAGVRLA
jgi:hypothetical protein